MTDEARRRFLIHRLVKIDHRYAAEQIAKWEAGQLPPGAPNPQLPGGGGSA